MADTPVTPDQITATQAATDQQNAFADSSARIAQTTDQATTGVTNLVQNGIQKVTAYAPLATAALLGVSQAATNFANGVDTSKIVTLNKQLDAIGAAVKRPGTGIADLTKIVEGLTAHLTKAGVSQSTFDSILKGTAGSTIKIAGALLDYAKTAAKVGEEQKVIQAGLIAQGAAAGSLGVVYDRAKNGLEDFNKLATKQQRVWDAATAATGMNREALAAYSAELNKVPGHLKDMIDSHDGGKRSSENFIKTLQLFRVSGRDYAAITKDMATATMQLGTTEKGAIDYTTRLSLVANKLQIPFEEMHKAITSSATAFKMFATEGKAGDEMAKNLEVSMGAYIKMLRDAHIPMSNAIEMSQHFAGAINEMTIGQKAFLSAQSGGPGGLMGAFQLDKLMDEGKIDQVMGKVQGVLRKQFGNIVTTAQASQSQSAAEQMTRQIQILRQGPLGKFASSDAEARKLLDAMSKPGAPKTPEEMAKVVGKDKPMEAFLNSGNKIAMGSQNILSQILGALGKSETMAVSGTAKVTQQFSGQSFQRPGTGAGSPELKENLKAYQQSGVHSGSSTMVDSLLKDLKNLPASLKASLSVLGTAFNSGNEDSIRSASANVNKTVADFQATAKGMPQDQQKAAMDSARTISDTVSKAVKSAMTPAGLGPGGAYAPGTVAAATQEITESPDYAKAGDRLPPIMPAPGGTGGPTSPGQIMKRAAMATQGSDDAAHRGASKPTGTGAYAPGGHGGHAGQPMPVSFAPGSSITVNFTGTCPHCGTQVDTTEVGKTTSVASGAQH